MEAFQIAILCVAIGFFLITLVLACFFLGKLSQQVKHATQISNLAALSGFFAAATGQGLKHSVVIQRVVEKYNILKDSEKLESAEALEQEFEKMLEPFEEPAQRAAKVKQFQETHDFDDLDIKDSV